jgi:transmembrane sensor
VPGEGPRELLARATDARSKGKPRDAAVALDTLRKRYRSDARAGLAAFELGRVRMDALADPAGAAEAFADAIALAPSAPFREDAEARRVEALDALPDRSRCEHARDAYLTRYPSGLHTKQIALRCKRP